MNRQGQVSLFWLMVFFLLILPMISNVFSERKVLAEDIKSGKLILTAKSSAMIQRGDSFLESSGGFSQMCHRGICAEDTDLYKAFIAKVWFDRARLEMEAE